MWCPDCGKDNSREEVKIYKFQYGDGIHRPKVILSAKHPMIICNECGCEMMDWRGSDVREKAVKDYLLEPKQ